MPTGNYMQWLGIAKRKSIPLPSIHDSYVDLKTAPTLEKQSLPTASSASLVLVSPFLDVLPYEIRLKIYGYLLADPRIIVADSNRLWRPYVDLFKRVKLWPSILATNRQIYDEAARVLYGSNTFFIGASQLWTA